MRRIELLRFARLLIVVPLLTACSGAASAPTATPGPSPSAPTPSPSATPVADFTLEVVPPEEPAAVRTAIPGQKVCLLVVVKDAPGAAAAPVSVTATAAKATILKITPAALKAGTVGEVWVVPAASSVEATASVTITATRGSVVRTATRTIPIFPMEGGREADAQPYFQRWVAWLAKAHPELGITAATKWQPEFVSTLLVVSHYAYWSDEWEMTIAWHVMIPPYDWTEVHLRHRGTEVAPSLAFRIDSVAGKSTPHPVTPPEVVVR